MVQFHPAKGIRQRVLAFGQFLLFAVAFYLLVRLLLSGIGLLNPEGILRQALAGNMCLAIAAVVATSLLSRLAGESFGSFGLGGRERMRLAVRGLTIGLLLLSALLLILRCVSGFRFGEFHGLVAVRFALLHALLFIVVAVAEETVWRGYALVKLAQCISFWPAAIILGAIFGFSHLNHATENYMGIAAASLFGVAFAWSFWRTGSLWFALGVHSAWDFGQSYIYGTPDSGVILPGALLGARMGGPKWLTGGQAGPEGSLLMLGVLTVFGLIVHRLPAAND